MALDRFIRWIREQPTQSQVESVLRNYFGGAVESIEWRTDRFLIRLPGKCSFPFNELNPGSTRGLATQSLFAAAPERFIEVWIGDESMDVLTRLTDHYTNGVAEALAAMFARYWEGEREE